MRRFLALATGVVLILALSGAAALATVASSTNLRPTGADGIVTILVLGSDVGPPRRPGDLRNGRADAIHLIAVDGPARKATIVNIPRDSYIGGDRINAHMSYGGPDAMVRVLEDYTGIPIDYYALTSFYGLQHMAAAMGGVEVTVDVPMHDDASGSNFDPGRVRLDSHASLAYVRDRKSLSDGDFGRTRNQGNYLRFVHRQLRRDHQGLSELLRLASEFARNTVTDIPTDRLMSLAMLASSIEPRDVLQESLTGSLGTTSGGASIVHLAPGDAFERIRRGRIGP